MMIYTVYSFTTVILIMPLLTDFGSVVVSSRGCSLSCLWWLVVMIGKGYDSGNGSNACDLGAIIIILCGFFLLGMHHITVLIYM